MAPVPGLEVPLDLAQQRPTGRAVDGAVIERAGDLVRKKGLGSDPEAQVIEDVICLVFLQTQYDPLLARLGEDKTADAVRKTMTKMGPAGLALAGEATAPGPGRDLLLRLASAG